MANSIALFKQYTTLLDEVYKNAALTSDLDGAPELARQGANANEMIIPKISMDGLANYSRNGGYVAGDVTMTNETVACNFDRGRMFNVDTLDNAETAGLAYGRLASEFIRTKVVPELDAFRFAIYAQIDGISKEAAALATGADVLGAIRTAANAFDEDEVPAEDRYLYITPTLLGLVEDLDTTKSKEVLKSLNVRKIPQSRFYTRITQYDGSSVGQTAGGYVKKAAETQSFTGDGSAKTFTVTAKPAEIDKITVGGTANTAWTYNAATGVITFTSAPANAAAIVASYNTGLNINFMLIHKPAVIQYQKHIAPKVIPPEANQSGDGWKFGYRNVGIADVYENKVAGIYLHRATT